MVHEFVFMLDVMLVIYLEKNFDTLKVNWMGLSLVFLWDVM
jgi:hypothetical protein